MTRTRALEKRLEALSAVVLALPEIEQRLLRAELLERSAADILDFYGVEARSESIQ